MLYILNFRRRLNDFDVFTSLLEVRRSVPEILTYYDLRLNSTYTMDVSMHSTMGNRMRMWPNRQRIGLRIRSASAGRDKRSGGLNFMFYVLFVQPINFWKLIELRNRSWAFLFDNLRRNIDEIYQICESDENVYECKVSNLYNYIYFIFPRTYPYPYILYIFKFTFFFFFF